MNYLFVRYQKLPKKEQTQIIILFVCMVLSAYMIVAVMMYENMFKVENLSNRKQNRIEARLEKFEMPESKPGFGIDNLNKLNKELAIREKELMAIGKKLMPMDEPTARQQTKLSITYLAEKHRIDIEQLDTAGTEIRKSDQGLSGEALIAIFDQRTVFSVSAQAQYFDFIDFVEDLPILPYLNYITKLEITPGNATQTQEGLLNIKFDLQM